tara:strand:+ start:609 stop:3137 length:2529 start_codon:yes stop_codon:yes gene_type:complete
MTPIQQMLLGTGVISEKPYLENMFAMTAYKGSGSARSIVNNVDISEGGLTITKSRDSDISWYWGSTAPSLGTNRWIRSDGINQRSNDNTTYTAFNTDGYSIGTNNGLNNSSDNYINYTFKKTPGLIDIVEFTGNDAGSRNISHNLGSVPGWIVIMCTTKNENKTVWHRSLTPTKQLFIDSGNGESSQPAFPSQPTNSQFTIGSYNNINGETYVAWIFAGGESPATTAHSVKFDGTDDYLTVPSDAGFAFGTGDFTVEAWVKNNGGFFTIFDHLMGADELIIFNYANGDVRVYSQGHMVSGVNPGYGKWYHLAVVRQSGSLQIYIDGLKSGIAHSFTKNITQAGIQIGRSANAAYSSGYISNLRVVKGTAVYTSSFRPPTEPLTNISGTVLLCCDDTAATGATVKPGTITAGSSPTGGHDSPFDDPAAFIFGGDEDQQIITCGSYFGNGSSTGPEINLGWEPQWVLIKRFDTSDDWTLYDSLRGITSNREDMQFKMNYNYDETTSVERLSLTGTGFKINSNDNDCNANNGKYAYVCIRRPDGYTGKPAKVGTDAFSIVMGNGYPSGGVPGFTTGWQVGYGMTKQATTSGAIYTGTSKTGQYALGTHDSSPEFNTGSWLFDHSTGWCAARATSENSWNWKRHKGFDVQVWTGDGATAGRDIAHCLNAVPEMMFVKKLNASTYTEYICYHVGMGNTKYVRLNDVDSVGTTNNVWNSTTPTSTHFTIGSSPEANNNGDRFVGMLFASIPGLSKCGSFSGSDSTLTIDLGFQPRMFWWKRYDSTGDWYLIDTTQGWGSGNDKFLYTNRTDAQGTYDFGAPTSSGLTLVGNVTGINKAGESFIYYAHA